MCQKFKQHAPEGAEAHSPGHPPWVYGLTKARRPARAKALIINAFALAGRFVVWELLPRAGALGYVLLPLRGRAA